MVDTDVLVYAAARSASEHQRCRAVVESWRRPGGARYVTGDRFGVARIGRGSHRPALFDAPTCIGRVFVL